MAVIVRLPGSVAGTSVLSSGYILEETGEPAKVLIVLPAGAPVGDVHHLEGGGSIKVAWVEKGSILTLEDEDAGEVEYAFDRELPPRQLQALLARLRQEVSSAEEPVAEPLQDLIRRHLNQQAEVMSRLGAIEQRLNQVPTQMPGASGQPPMQSGAMQAPIRQPQVMAPQLFELFNQGRQPSLRPQDSAGSRRQNLEGRERGRRSAGAALDDSSRSESSLDSSVRPETRQPPRTMAMAPPPTTGAMNGPPVAPPVQEEDPSKLLMKLLLRKAKEDTSSEDEDLTTMSKNFKGIARLRKRVERRPDVIVLEYVSRVKASLGVTSDRQWWSHRQYSTSLLGQFGKSRGLFRVHYYIGYTLELLANGQSKQAEATLVQLAKACHQCALDGGSWNNASLLLPIEDPLQRQAFGGSELELSWVNAYKAGLATLQTSLGKHSKDDEPSEKPPAQAKAKAKAKSSKDA